MGPGCMCTQSKDGPPFSLSSSVRPHSATSHRSNAWVSLFSIALFLFLVSRSRFLRSGGRGKWATWGGYEWVDRDKEGGDLEEINVVTEED